MPGVWHDSGENSKGSKRNKIQERIIMAKKQYLFKEDARKKLLEAAEIAYKAVGSSYSPKGRLTAIARPYGFPLVHQDGVNIFKELPDHSDSFINQGLLILLESAKKQVEIGGDGTTAVVILTYHLIEKGMKLLDEGVNPAIIRKQINAALPPLLAELKKLSTPVKSREDVLKIARIASADDEIADIVTQAVEKIGEDGQITVEDNKFPVMEVSYSDGLQIEKGYSTPYFVTDVDRMEAVLENAGVIILGHKITTQLEAQLLLESAISKHRNLLIIGEVEGEAMRMCVVNKIKGVLNLLVVPPPANGEKRKELLDDIALVTGARIIEKDDLPLNKEQFAAQFKTDWIGQVKTVVAKEKQTLLVRTEEKDQADPEAKKKVKERNKEIESRLELLRRKIKESGSIYDKEKYQERLAKLTTGVGVIKVGSKVDVDLRERVERTKDAVASAKACRKEGIVPGGGIIFLQMAKILENKDRNFGEELLYQTLQEPTRKLLSNAGEDKTMDKIIAEIKKKGGNFGYNCESEKIEDLVKSGVIDASMVISLALTHACIVATKILLTDTLIADLPDDSNMKQI